MKRILSLLVVGAMALGSVAIVGVSTASAAGTTPTTIKLTDPKAIYNDGSFNIIRDHERRRHGELHRGQCNHRWLRGGRHVDGEPVPRHVLVDASGSGRHLTGRFVHGPLTRLTTRLPRRLRSPKMLRRRCRAILVVRSRSTSTPFSRAVRLGCWLPRLEPVVRSPTNHRGPDNRL